MSKLYKISEFDVTVIGKDGNHVSINCKPVGYWGEVIRLDVRRGWHDSGWEVQISHSSGGRDTKEVKSDIEAEYNFAQGLIEMCAIGRMIEEHFDLFEENYQAWLAELNADAAREKAEEQAKIDADPAIGTEKAVELVALMTKYAQTNNKDMDIKAVVRGSNHTVGVKILVKNRAKVGYRFYGNVASKAKAIEFIAASSIRTLDQQAA